MTCLTHSEAETLALAARLSPMLAAGDSVLLSGDLGAGKSVLARGIARGMGVTGAMPSPTFTLMVPYEVGGKKLYHFDLYRLEDPDEYYAAGLDEFVGGDGAAVIEWPDRADLAPEACIAASLARCGNDDDARTISIALTGLDGRREAIENALAKWRLEP